jgi:hypothetical protein
MRSEDWVKGPVPSGLRNLLLRCVPPSGNSVYYISFGATQESREATHYMEIVEPPQEEDVVRVPRAEYAAWASKEQELRQQIEASESKVQAWQTQHTAALNRVEQHERTISVLNCQHAQDQEELAKALDDRDIARKASYRFSN